MFRKWNVPAAFVNYTAKRPLTFRKPGPATSVSFVEAAAGRHAGGPAV